MQKIILRVPSAIYPHTSLSFFRSGKKQLNIRSVSCEGKPRKCPMQNKSKTVQKR